MLALSGNCPPVPLVAKIVHDRNGEPIPLTAEQICALDATVPLGDPTAVVTTYLHDWWNWGGAEQGTLPDGWPHDEEGFGHHRTFVSFRFYYHYNFLIDRIESSGPSPTLRSHN